MKNTPKIISKDGIELKLEWVGNQIATVSRTMGSLTTTLKRYVVPVKNDATIVYHHFLLYYPWAEDPWQMASQRYQPKGVPDDVALPRRHFFHVHRTEAIEKLRLLVQDRNTKPVVIDDIQFFDHLIDEIEQGEKQTMLILGGVGLVLGFFAGPMAVIAGLAGVLAPRIGSGMAKVSLGALGKKLNQIKRTRAEKAARKVAAKELSKYEVIINPVLAIVWRAIENGHHLEAAETIAEAMEALPETMQAPTRNAIWAHYGASGVYTCETAPWLYFCEPDSKTR